MRILREEALAFALPNAVSASQHHSGLKYEEYFPEFAQRGIELEMLDKELGNFDLTRLASALKPERDKNFQFLGLQTLYDRYFLHSNGVRYELPQAFFMRVAMGLAVREIDRDARAIEFYELLSSFDFMCSTPTLFNSGTLRPQLSSCFLTTISDHLDGIFKSIKDNALLSKYAGGLGDDWSNLRGLGAHIKGTNGQSQGVVPFLKVANKRIGWHTFRHSAASLLGKNGEDIKVVQELLRHANSRITQDVYQHADRDDKRSALSHFSGLFVVPTSKAS